MVHCVWITAAGRQSCSFVAACYGTGILSHSILFCARSPEVFFLFESENQQSIVPTVHYPVSCFYCLCLSFLYLPTLVSTCCFCTDGTIVRGGKETRQGKTRQSILQVCWKPVPGPRQKRREQQPAASYLDAWCTICKVNNGRHTCSCVLSTLAHSSVLTSSALVFFSSFSRLKLIQGNVAQGCTSSPLFSLFPCFPCRVCLQHPIVSHAFLHSFSPASFVVSSALVRTAVS